jgi:carbamoyltransferase
MGTPPHALLCELGEKLRQASYDSARLKQLLGIDYPDDVGPLNRAAAAERLRNDFSAAAALIRLLFLEQAQPARSLTAALSRPLLDGLETVGLFQRKGQAVSSRLRIDAIQDLLLLSDLRFGRPDRSALGLRGADPVYPPCSDSFLLADSVTVAQDSLALDLGTGSGVQGLAAARRARRVVAVDVNARAVELARCNASLNGIANFDVRRGDLYRPVRGRRFDLILANPPFVASPKNGPLYHSGGPRGDGVVRRVIGGLSAHLTERGSAFIITHLAIARGQSMESLIGPWFADFPGGVLILSLETGSAVDLAAAQALFALERGFAGYEREVRRWVKHLDRERIEQIALALIVAQRGRQRGIEAVDASRRILPLPLSRPAKEYVKEWLAQTAPSTNGESPLPVAPAV